MIWVPAAKLQQDKMNSSVPVVIRDEVMDPSSGKVKMIMEAPIFNAKNKLTRPYHP